MPSPFDAAIAGGLASLRQVNQRSIVYTNAADTFSVTIPLAGAAETEYEIDDGNGNIVETWVSRDYLIAVSDLVLNAVNVVPAAGDTIQETINGIARTFTVLVPPGKQSKPFVYSDRGQTQFRVHTQETG